MFSYGIAFGLGIYIGLAICAAIQFIAEVIYSRYLAHKIKCLIKKIFKNE